MPRNTFKELKRYCIVCQNQIPDERKSDAVTCSPFCSKLRKDWQRARVDSVSCRYCQRPSTPEERERYMAWRRWEKKGQNEEQSAAKLLHEVQRLQKKLKELEAR